MRCHLILKKNIKKINNFMIFCTGATVQRVSLVFRRTTAKLTAARVEYLSQDVVQLHTYVGCHGHNAGRVEFGKRWP